MVLINEGRVRSHGRGWLIVSSVTLVPVSRENQLLDNHFHFQAFIARVPHTLGGKPQILELQQDNRFEIHVVFEVAPWMTVLLSQVLQFLEAQLFGDREGLPEHLYL